MVEPYRYAGANRKWYVGMAMFVVGGAVVSYVGDAGSIERQVGVVVVGSLLIGVGASLLEVHDLAVMDEREVEIRYRAAWFSMVATLNLLMIVTMLGLKTDVSVTPYLLFGVMAGGALAWRGALEWYKRRM